MRLAAEHLLVNIHTCIKASAGSSLLSAATHINHLHHVRLLSVLHLLRCSKRHDKASSRALCTEVLGHCVGVRSPFGSHVAERLLDALGRHAAESDAEASATAEQVRRVLQGAACTAAWLRLDPVRQIIRCHQWVCTWLQCALPRAPRQANHAAECIAEAWHLQSRCDAYASRHGHPTACGICDPCSPLV